MSKLSKLDQLYIRACKSEEPTKRLESLYRRFYRVGNQGTYWGCIRMNLARIIDETVGYPIERFLSDRCEQRSYRGEQVTDDSAVLNALVNRLRFTDASTLKAMGYVTPRRFRNY